MIGAGPPSLDLSAPWCVGHLRGVLPVTLDQVRLFVHVLAASVWVGGQLTILGILPAVRTLGEDAPGTVARRFNQVAWPAFAVAVFTGMWELLEIDIGETSNAYQATLMVKLLVVVATGVGAAAHSSATTKAGTAIWGAVSLLAGLAAFFLGIQLSA